MTSAARAFLPLVEHTRCGVAEIIHQGVVSVSGVTSEVFSLGKSETLVPLRSTAKPFLVAGFLNTILRKEEFTDAELALMASSHNGEPEHIASILTLLDRYEILPQQLRCGTHTPYHHRSQSTALGNNCSGKHALFLIASKVAGLNLEDYLNPSTPLNEIFRQELRQSFSVLELLPGIDGCSIPTYAVPISSLSRAYARFATDDLSSAHTRVRKAYEKHPFELGGTDRLDSYLVERYGLAAKSGSDGVWAVGIPHLKLGIAVKIIGADEAAAELVVLDCLNQLQCLQAKTDPFLESFYARPLLSWAGRPAGEIRPCFGKLAIS